MARNWRTTWPPCSTWDYWATGGRDGRAGDDCACPSCSAGDVLPGGWEAWARVAEARRRARAVITREIEAGRWWVPRGFTVADLDALIAKVYG